jgi:DNA-directed RNA polymerase alpha subunit
VAEEVVKYLQTCHLRLGMTDSEIEYFNEVGRAPEISEASGVRVLNISYRAIFVLEAEGLKTLGDLNKLSDKQLWSIPGVGKISIKKIYEALAKVRDKPGSTCHSKLTP